MLSSSDNTASTDGMPLFSRIKPKPFRFFPRRVSVKWRNVCACVIFLGVAAAFSFVTQQTILWGAWSCDECVQHAGGCSEAVYDFGEPSLVTSFIASVQYDQQVLDKCGIASQSGASATLPAPFPSTAAPGRHAIKTKCGWVTPHLLSRQPASARTPPPPSDQPLHQQQEQQHYVAPNIVHYVSFGRYNFSFLNYLSFLSVHKHVRPRAIYVHGDALPVGAWWERTLRDVSGLYHVAREEPVRVQGYRLPWVTHSSNIIRLQTILDNGGIYLDTDILALRGFDELRRHDAVLGRESRKDWHWHYGINNGIIVARPNAPFVCLWFETYRTYQPWPWIRYWHGLKVPYKLAEEFPDYVHIEEDTLHQPSPKNHSLMFQRHYDWSRNYAMHIWKHFGHVPEGPEEIRQLNSTLGEVMRYVYFGTKDFVH